MKKVQSKLNNFEEYTAVDAGELAEYVGFTSDEVGDICQSCRMDYEDSLASAIYLAFIYALNEYECYKEVTAGKGFADLVYVPVTKGIADRPALVIELKHNKTAESGLDQIRRKEYYECLRHYQGNLLLVGINYGEVGKTHDCVIERFEM